jgi:hypothetical protein
MPAPHWIQRFNEERWNWIYCGCLVIWAGIFVFIFGWFSALAGALLAGLIAVGWRRLQRRDPRFSLTELGAIEMEIPECRATGTLSPRNLRWFNWICGGLVILAFFSRAWDEFFSHQESPRTALFGFTVKLCVICFYGFTQYVSYEPANISMVVAESGLFWLVDPSRPWLRRSDARASNLRLRASKIYGWDQVERFHWSRRRKGYTLHLSIRQPNFSTPQLISYDLPSLSEAEQHQLDAVLHKHVSPVSGPVTVTA